MTKVHNPLTQREERRVIQATILALIVPIIVENVLGMLANFINSAMLGHVDIVGLMPDFEVSVQGLAASVTGIFWNLFKGISIGATIMVAQADGRGDRERMHEIARQTIFSLFLVGLVSGAFLFVFAENFIGFFDSNDPEVVKAATNYLRIAAFGFPFLGVQHAVTGALQGQGDMRTPMWITTAFNAINLLTIGILIYGPIDTPFRSALGAALALVVGQAVAAGIGLTYMVKRKGLLQHEDGRLIRLTRPIQKDLYRLGIPTSLESIFWQLSAIVLGRVILQLGNTAYAANQLGLQAEALSEMPALGFGVAATTLTGRALGAQDSKLGKGYIRELMKGAGFVITFGMIILLVFPQQLMSLLTSDPEIIRLGSTYLRIMGLIQIPQNLQRVYTGALKGAGDANKPMIIAGIGLWGIRVPFSLIAYYVFDASIVVIWSIVAFDQTLRFILSYIFYRHKKIWQSEQLTVAEAGVENATIE